MQRFVVLKIVLSFHWKAITARAETFGSAAVGMLFEGISTGLQV